MKNKIFIYMSLLFMGLIANSCSEDYLDLNPIAANDESAFYKTMNDAKQAVTAAYSQFNNIAVWDRDILMAFGDVASDDGEAGGEYVNEVPDIEKIDYLQTDPTVTYLDDTYGTLYRAINFANIAIEKLPSIKDTDPEVDIDLLNKRIAEAKFVRAINFFYLTIIFGEVPLVDHVLGASEYSMGRSNLKDIYNLIEQDLKDAIAVLPEKGGWGDDAGRATKGAAQALLARTYLYESSYAKYYGGSDPRYSRLTERWAEALSYAEAVINSGAYKLVGIEGEKYNTWRGPNTDGYRYIFTVEGDNSPETVFEIQSIEDGEGYNDSRGSSMTRWTCARNYISAKGVKTSTTEWGLGLPHPALKAAFDDGDARLRTTITWEGGDSVGYQIVSGETYPISFDDCVTKCYQRKWECSAAQFELVSKTWNSGPCNIKLIRYSDVYLMAAEAALALGKSGDALGYINKVRERARNCGTKGQPAALTSISFADIVHERRLEFAGEGHRFYDLVRWNMAYDLLNSPSFSNFIDRVYQKGKNEYQPLPQREIDLSQGNLQQYVAY